MKDPPAAPRPDLEAEWYRRRRAAKADLPLPADFRVLDDEETGIELRVPVALWPLPTTLRARLALGFVLFLVVTTALDVLSPVRPPLRLLFLVSATLSSLPVLALASIRRVVAVRAAGVEVGWWPLSPISPLSRRLVSREIRQVFVQRFEPAPDLRSGPWALMTRDEPQPGFEVWILRPDGRRERLVGAIDNAEHALYLEGWLERRLGIPDEPVAGEYGV